MVIKVDKFLGLLPQNRFGCLLDSPESPSFRKKRKQCGGILISNRRHVIALIFESLFLNLLVLEKHLFSVV